MEMPREMKRERRHLEYFWVSTKDVLNQAQMRVAIRIYFVVVRVVKSQYFCCYCAHSLFLGDLSPLKFVPS